MHFLEFWDPNCCCGDQSGNLMLLMLCRPCTANTATFSFPYTEHLRTQFNQTFYDRCGKYSLIRDYTKHLESGHLSRDRFVVFVFQEKGLSNGGLGDRFAGLITAMNFAIRFNRTLLVRSENQFGRLFTPFHPLPEVRARLSYDNWTQWATSYDRSWENHDETEHDMWYCINAGGNPRCTLEHGDVSQPVILFRSNRCFLCYDWFHHLSSSAHNDLLRLVSEVDGEKKDSFSSGGDHHSSPVPNLFEIGGCLLRLAAWPTDLLWKEVDRYYSELSGHLHLTEKTKHDDKLHEVNQRRKLVGGNDSKKKAGPFFQIGMHFRCGDHSFQPSASGTSNCVYNDSYIDFLSKESTNINRGIMIEGTPHDLGKCAAIVAANQTKWLVGHHIPIAERGETNFDPSSHQLLVSLGSSDNMDAAKQMVDVSLSTSRHIAGGLLSPSGCHVDVHDMFECLKSTVVTWFALSLSDVLVVQTPADAHYPAPASAFSRYAGLYSLKKNIFRDARHCDEAPDDQIMGLTQQGNWFCTN
eukprot:scaffold292_cov161-Ochromonas_danica.AAC.6